MKGSKRKRESARFWTYEVVPLEQTAPPPAKAKRPNLKLELAFEEDQEEFEALRERITKPLFGWCTEAVLSNFVEDSLTLANIIAVGFRPGRKHPKAQRGSTRTDVGAVLANFPGHEHKDELYIRLICSTPGTGRELLELFLQYVSEAPQLRNVKYVTLAALPRVINFYRRLGFVNAQRECTESPELTQLAKAAAGRVFKTDAEAVADEQFRPFLEQLVKNKMVAKKDCQGIGVDENKNECSAFGYTMTFCPQRKSKAPF